MSRRKKQNALDLFCGAGGMSLGAKMTGVNVRIVVNHWARAIATHTQNFPRTQHLCLDADKVDLREIAKTEKIEVLLASPECTNHCRAKGGLPYNEQSRATAWQVVRFVEFLKPEVFIVENVEEFLEWGPLDNSGRPVTGKKGDTFHAWVMALRSFGYNVEWNTLIAADYGAATTRKRLFVVGKRSGPVQWPKAETPQPKWKPASSIIDWNFPTESAFDRKVPLSDNTWRRIKIGIEKFWPEPFVAIMKGQSTVRSIQKPIPTVTTEAHLYLVKPLIVLAKWDKDNVKPADQPLPSITTIPSLYVAHPFLVKMYGTANVQPINKPLGTITAGGNKFACLQPFLVQYNGTSTAYGVHKPLPTITTKDHFGLVRPTFRYDGADYMLDLGFRMLQPHELAAATGFPTDYIITGGKCEQRKQIGNAVPPGMARALVAANM